MAVDFYFVSAIFLSLCTLIVAGRDRQIYCGACIAMAMEMEWKISQIDPKQRLQVGSFRIDPKGNQRLKQVPLAQSEAHLMEVLESICDELNSYATTTSKETGHVAYMRTSTPDGAAISLENVQIDTGTQKKLKYACQHILEDHEDEVIKLYQETPDKSAERICVDLVGFCTRDNVTAQITATANGIAAAAADRKDKEDEQKEDADDDTDDEKDDDDINDDEDGDASEGEKGSDRQEDSTEQEAEREEL